MLNLPNYDLRNPNPNPNPSRRFVSRLALCAHTAHTQSTHTLHLLGCVHMSSPLASPAIGRHASAMHGHVRLSAVHTATAAAARSMQWDFGVRTVAMASGPGAAWHARCVLRGSVVSQHQRKTK